MNIVIIDLNKIFRESLKTVLDQISDFNVIFDSDNPGSLEEISNVQVHFILLDYSLGKARCNETIGTATSLWPAVNFLFLTNDKEDCIFENGKISDIVLKNSSKKEFEIKIRKQQSMKTNNLTN